MDWTNNTVISGGLWH